MCVVVLDCLFIYCNTENADKTLRNRVCELVQVNNIYKARVVSCPDSGSYVIEFPHVTEALIMENLLPSGESDIHEVTCFVFPHIHPFLSYQLTFEGCMNWLLEFELNVCGCCLCGLVVRVSGYRYRGLGFDSRRYQIF